MSLRKPLARPRPRDGSWNLETGIEGTSLWFGVEHMDMFCTALDRFSVFCSITK